MSLLKLVCQLYNAGSADEVVSTLLEFLVQNILWLLEFIAQHTGYSRISFLRLQVRYGLQEWCNQEPQNDRTQSYEK